MPNSERFIGEPKFREPGEQTEQLKKLVARHGSKAVLEFIQKQPGVSDLQMEMVRLWLIGQYTPKEETAKRILALFDNLPPGTRLVARPELAKRPRAKRIVKPRPKIPGMKDEPDGFHLWASERARGKRISENKISLERIQRESKEKRTKA